MDFRLQISILSTALLISMNFALFSWWQLTLYSNRCSLFWDIFLSWRFRCMIRVRKNFHKNLVWSTFKSSSFMQQHNFLRLYYIIQSSLFFYTSGLANWVKFWANCILTSASYTGHVLKILTWNNILAKESQLSSSNYRRGT